MLDDLRIQEAIANGERNRAAIQRVHNWCAHARVNCEAQGMLASMTGLPIGHHSIQCQFANDDTTSSYYEVSLAAVDFYDRNCVDCAHRVPVRLPNISEDLGDRDRERERRDAAAAREAAAADCALQARVTARQALRATLSPIGQTLIDDIGAYDRDRSEEKQQLLMRSAQMAPEHFAPALQEYIFKVCETENWLDAPGLEILHALGTDPARLAAVAARAVAKGAHRKLAARILVPLVEHLTDEDARSATPGAIDLAAPDRRFSLGREEQRSDPALLNLLYRHYRKAVDTAIESLLSMGKAWPADSAGRGIVALQREFPDAGDVHARALIATYVRAKLLLTDYREFENDLHAIEQAVVGAFDAQPSKIDALLQDYMGATGSSYRKRVFDLYARALRAGFDKELPPGSERVGLAFRRLLWATTGEFDDGVLQNAVEVFRDRSRDLIPVAALEIDALLGAPFLLAERLREHEKAPLDPTHPMASIQRSTELSYYRSLMKAMISLAGRAAAEDKTLLPKIGAFLESIPEDREYLRSVAVERLVELTTDVDGLEIYLPHLYRAMVGPSSLERAGAAKAIGELRREAVENLPPLVLETFVPLLLDSYVIVHKSAARSLRSSTLPEPLRMEALNSLYQLIRHYRTQSGADQFLADCVRTLAGSADAFGKASGTLRRYLIEVCMDIDPIYIRSELRSLRHTLGKEDDFAKLVIRLLPHMIDRFNRSDEAQNLVMTLTPAAVLAHSKEFEALGRTLAPADPWLTLVLVDALARAGAQGAATRLARARIDALEDNPRNHGQRLSGEQVELAFQFEAAVAGRDTDALIRIAARWIEIGKELKARREEQRERDRRGRFPFSH